MRGGLIRDTTLRDHLVTALDAEVPVSHLAKDLRDDRSTILAVFSDSARTEVLR